MFGEPPVFHVYEMWEPRLPQVGDKAMCGHVKTEDDPDYSVPFPSWGQECVVCEDLDRYWEWVYDDFDVRRVS